MKSLSSKSGIFVGTILFLAAVVSIWAQEVEKPPSAKESQSQREFRFQVKHDHLRKSCRGELVINDEGAAYITEFKDHERKWSFVDIKMFKLNSKTELEILTYQTNHLKPTLNQAFKVRADESFKFEILDGEITARLSEFLMSKIKKPMATTFIESAEATSPVFVLPVRHRHRWGGCNGELRIYPERIAYESFDDPTNSRLWRWSDIKGLGRSDRYKFEITTYEPQLGGPSKTFNFDLKEEMTDEMYDFIWKKFYNVTYYAPTRNLREAENPQ